MAGQRTRRLGVGWINVEMKKKEIGLGDRSVGWSPQMTKVQSSLAMKLGKKPGLNTLFLLRHPIVNNIEKVGCLRVLTYFELVVCCDF